MTSQKLNGERRQIRACTVNRGNESGGVHGNIEVLPCLPSQ
jgi:hypothetical protein